MPESRPFAKRFIVGGGNMDCNGHMRNTAFLDRSADGSRFVVRNQIHRPEGELCAKLTSSCAWLDLAARPPQQDCKTTMEAR